MSLTRPPAVVTAKNYKWYPGFLGHAVRGMCYIVVANRRQPNLYTTYITGGAGGVIWFRLLSVGDGARFERHKYRYV